MATESADEFRARAVQARRISDNMHKSEAQTELRGMADALDAEAKRLDDEEAMTTKASREPKVRQLTRIPVASVIGEARKLIFASNFRAVRRHLC